MTFASNRFFSYARYGLAASLPYAEQPEAVAKVPLDLWVDNEQAQLPPVRFYGPGDIIGINQNQIRRTEPVHMAQDFPPHHFPAIEFHRPDFPWVFTPTGPAGSQLMPWLTLVVVRKTTGVTITFEKESPVPVLRIAGRTDARTELFDIAEAWAWAHVQVEGITDAQAARTALEQGNAISRLVCPRRLEPETEYYACVVPTFVTGWEVGRGREPNMPRLEVTHKYGAYDADLPVYYHWEFRTGKAGGDFRSLVKRLKPGALPGGFGLKPIRMGRPGYGLEGPGVDLPLSGLLQLVGAAPASWPDEKRQPFQQALRALLNTPDTLTEPVVAPPVYGRWQAGVSSLPEPGQAPLWLTELNLDPRHRIVAGLGTRVVQAEQEKLMAQAWEQLRQARELNKKLSAAQLAQTVGESLRDKRLKPMPLERLLPIAGPVADQVQVAAPQAPDLGEGRMGKLVAPVAARSLKDEVQESILPNAVVSVAFQRIARPQGALGRRLLGQAGKATFDLVQPLNEAVITPAEERKVPDGAVTLDAVSGKLGMEYADIRFEFATPEEVEKAPGWEVPSAPPPDQPPPTPGQVIDGIKDDIGRIVGGMQKSTSNLQSAMKPLRMRDDEDLRDREDGEGGIIKRPPRPYPKPPQIPVDDAAARKAMEERFRAAAARQQEYLLKVASLTTAAAPPPLVTANLADALLTQLDPAVTVPETAREQMDEAPDGTFDRPDPLAPIQFAPHFDQPMYASLTREARDLVFPGLEGVGPDTITAAEVNPAFLEAYMVGLNHEMSRELLWREFPAPMGATFFQRFWSTGAEPDIEPIHTWPQGNRLGETAGRKTAGRVMLLLRGALLERYPDAEIFALPAVAREDGGTGRVPGPDNTRRDAMVRGALGPGIAAVGFDLTREQARGDTATGDLGWFLIIQTRPESAGFGVPAGLETPPATIEEKRNRTHVWITELAAVPAPGGATAGVPVKSAAEAADRTVLRPTRYARHFATVLPASATPHAEEGAGE